MIAQGSKVRIHYIGTYDDGAEFDNSYKLGETLEFVLGGGHMITGVDRAVADMDLGEKRKVRLEPAEAYGEWREDFVEQVPCDYLPNWEDLPIGEPVVLQAQNGQQIQVTVSKVEDGFVFLDHNHFLAGKPINFEIEVVEVCEPGSFEPEAHDSDCDCGCHDHEGAGAHEHDHGHAHDHEGAHDHHHDHGHAHDHHHGHGHDHAHGESCGCGCH